MPKAMIVGAGELASEKNSGKSADELYVEAIERALIDAELEPGEIDGLYTCGALFEQGFMQAHRIKDKAGFKSLSVCDIIDAGGASPVIGIRQAKSAVEEGRAKTIVVAAADNVGKYFDENPIGFLAKAAKAIGHPRYLNPEDWGKPAIPLLYNEIAEWYCKNYDVLREDLALVPVLASEHASFHQGALNRKVLTQKQVLESKEIASYTTILECARPADGGAAVVVSYENRQGNGITILGGGEIHHHKAEVDFSSDFGPKQAFDDAFDEAEICIESIDTAWIYDCFPIAFIDGIEAAGFCKKGEGLYLLQEGYFSLQGVGGCPINTNGGLLSHGAPWGAPGMAGTTEVVLQLRGEAGDRQVAGAKCGLVYNNGGISSSHSVVILAS